MSFGVEDLQVRYGHQVAVAGVSFDAPAGEVLAVVGGDGAGKTSTLRALAGVLRPAAGRVRRPPAARLGYVSAGPGVWRELTVAENLAFVGASFGLGRAERRRRAGRLLEQTGLAPAAGRLAGRLSGGMRQQLAFAMALVPEPALLVLDEPTTGVDPVSRAELWRLIASAAAGGAAVVLSTAYLDEAERAASVVVLADGRPLVAGVPDTLVAAAPGVVLDCPARPPGSLGWRRGAGWRVWSPDGSIPPGARRAETSLEDAVIIAAFDRLRQAKQAVAA